MSIGAVAHKDHRNLSITAIGGNAQIQTLQETTLFSIWSR